MYPRKTIFSKFENYQNPTLSITSRVNWPNFMPFCRVHKISPYHLLLYCVAKSSNEVEEFSYRAQKGEIQPVESLKISYTLLADEQLKFATFSYHDDFDVFLNRAVTAKNFAEEPESRLSNTTDNLDLNFIYFSCLPWLDILSVGHPYHGDSTNSIPQVIWGKFEEIEKRIELPFAVQAHHGLVDGYHINKLIHQIEKNIKNLLTDSTLNIRLWQKK